MSWWSRPTRSSRAWPQSLADMAEAVIIETDQDVTTRSELQRTARAMELLRCSFLGTVFIGREAAKRPQQFRPHVALNQRQLPAGPFAALGPSGDAPPPLAGATTPGRSARCGRGRGRTVGRGQHRSTDGTAAAPSGDDHPGAARTTPGAARANLVDAGYHAFEEAPGERLRHASGERFVPLSDTEHLADEIGRTCA